MDPAVVVALDALDRHGAALEHARLEVRLEAGADDHPAAATEHDAVDLDLGQALRGVVDLASSRPCSRFSCSGVTADARSIISRTAGSCSAICAALLVAEHRTCRTSASSISVLSNRLPRLSGAICGWSGSTIAAPSMTSSAGDASTGQVLTQSQGASS